MNFSVPHSTPKRGLSATKQACSESGSSKKFFDGKQLSLFESLQSTERGGFQKTQKPQTSSIPGISPKERDRYRVVLGNEILGDRLTLDEALKLAKEGES